MLAFLRSPRKLAARFALVLSALWLAACEPVGLVGGGPRIDPSQPVQVAMLLPLGSPTPGDATVARALQNAARLAVAEQQGARIDLRVYDTAGDAGRAARVATQAADEGAQVILGPLRAGAAAAASVAVAPRDINVLAFSNNPGIAGGNVFVLGTTFDTIAGRLARYAAALGQGNIHVVYGRDPAEQIGRDAIVRAIGASPATLAGTTPFDLSQQGVVAAVPQIAQEVRASGAEAIFFTSGNTGALPFLVDLLPERGIGPDTTQYIGLQRLDLPPSALSSNGLQGSIFALPDPEATSRFVSRYRAAYGDAPHPLAGLAYDGITAVSTLVASGDSRALTAGALTRNAGFGGAYGAFRLRADGSSDRALAVARISNNQVSIVDPAPRNFGRAGF